MPASTDSQSAIQRNARAVLATTARNWGLGMRPFYQQTTTNRPWQVVSLRNFLKELAI
jgi:hypothetical protein